MRKANRQIKKYAIKKEERAAAEVPKILVPNIGQASNTWDCTVPTTQPDSVFG